MDLGNVCDISYMRNIRRAFQRKHFRLWMPETAVARWKRRKRFLGPWKRPVTPIDDYPDKVGYGGGLRSC